MHRPRPIPRTLGGVLALAADARRLLVSVGRFSRIPIWSLSIAVGSVAVLAGCSSGASDIGPQPDAPTDATSDLGDSSRSVDSGRDHSVETGVDDTGTFGTDGSDPMDAEPNELGGVEPFETVRFNDPAPEAAVGTRYESNRGRRDVSALESQLSDRGWASYNYHVGNNLFYSDEEAVEGSHAMEFCFPGDERMGFDLKRELGRDEVWVQYEMKFEQGFDVTDDDFKGGVDWGNGGKFPGFAWRTGSVGCAGGGDWHEGCEGWSARGMFWDPKKAGYAPHNESGRILLSYYVYHRDLEGSYGETEHWTENDAGLIESGTWYEVTMHVRINTPGEADGVLEAWVDGTKAYERRDWRFRGADASSVDVGAWWHVAYFGGGWYSPEDQSLYTDDLRFFDESPL